MTLCWEHVGTNAMKTEHDGQICVIDGVQILQDLFDVLLFNPVDFSIFKQTDTMWSGF